MESLEFHNPNIEKYEDLLSRDECSKAFAPLSELYRKLGLYDKAFRILKEGTRLHPSYLPGYLSLGRCYYDMEKFDSAYSVVHPFIDTHGDNLALLKLLARTYTKLDMPDEALDTYRRLLFLSPKDVEAEEGIVRLENQGKGTDGEAFDVDGIDRKPKGGRGADGWTELSLGDGVEPLTLIEHKTTSQKSSSSRVTQRVVPVATLTLADLYRDQSHPDKAKAVLRTMLATAATSPSDRREAERRLEALKTGGYGCSREVRLLRFLKKIREKSLEYSQKEC